MGDGRNMFFSKSVFNENNEAVEVELICNKCGKIITISNMEIFDKVQSDYCIISHDKNIKCSCGNNSGNGLIEYKKLVSLPKHDNIATTQPNTPKCPTCGSTNIEKIGGMERAGSIAMWGIFSKKINKTFKCKKCGYTW